MAKGCSEEKIQGTKEEEKTLKGTQTKQKKVK
jgi:hypothetical protein